MTYFWWTLYSIATAIVAIGAMWFLAYVLASIKKENIRRHVFEKTQSYVQGKIQDLSNYKLQMDTTKDVGNKSAIKAVIRSQFANFDINDCPDELKSFLTETRGY